MIASLAAWMPSRPTSLRWKPRLRQRPEISEDRTPPERILSRMSNLQPSLSSSSPLARMTRQIRALAGRLAVKASPDWRRVLEASARPYEHIYPDLSKYADQARIFTQSSWVYVAV